MNRDCDECWQHSKDWIRLSQIAHKQFTIARTDCHFDHDVCRTFLIDRFPFILYFNNNKIYRYSGALDTPALLKYLSADNYITS